MPPHARAALVIGKLAAGLITGAAAVAVTLTLAVTVFGLRIPLDRIPLLTIYTALTALSSAGIGLAIGAWLKDYRSVQPVLVVALAGSFFASGGFSSVPTLPPTARAIDNWWPIAHVFETLNNQVQMAQIPAPGMPLLSFAVAALVATTLGATITSKRL